MRLSEVPPSTKFMYLKKLYKRLRMTITMAHMIESHFLENMIPVLTELDEVAFFVAGADVHVVEEEPNHSITVTINGLKQCFTGDTIKDCLDKLRTKITELADKDNLSEAEIEKDYKELRTLTKPTAGEWVVDIQENGAGESRPFPTKKQAINFFMRCASESGDHWD